jgi:malonyl-ACP O-methyltransferase BioC
LCSDLTTYLDEKKINKIILVGWSMGANLGLDFCRNYPDRVSKLYLLSMRASWPDEEIKNIRAGLHADPHGFMTGFYRKCFLGHKKDYLHFMKKIKNHLPVNLNLLDSGLNYLAAYRLDSRPLATIKIKIIHGAKDVVAPVAEVPSIAGSTQNIIPHAGHPVFLAPSFSLKDKMRKETVRRKFSRAADTYDEHAHVQKETAQRLFTLLPNIRYRTILEIGCGTGNYTSLLLKKLPEALITALDFSPEMIQIAQKKTGSHHVHFLCRDGENYLTGDTGCFDLITSNGALQWFDRPDLTFTHIQKRLTSSGLFLFSIFGPETLQELRQGFDAVLDIPIELPAASFPDRKKLTRSLEAVFDHVEIDELRLTKKYDSLLHLLRHLQKTGTGGFQESGPVLTPSRLKKLDQWFSRQNSYRLTYQIFMIRCCGRAGNLVNR